MLNCRAGHVPLAAGAIKGFTLLKFVTISGSLILVVILLAAALGFYNDYDVRQIGWLLDRSPGAARHQDVFAVVTGLAILGMLASIIFHRVTKQSHLNFLTFSEIESFL